MPTWLRVTHVSIKVSVNLNLESDQCWAFVSSFIQITFDVSACWDICLFIHSGLLNKVSQLCLKGLRGKKKKNYLQVASITNFNGAICTKIGLNYMSETFASVFPKTEQSLMIPV